LGSSVELEEAVDIVPDFMHVSIIIPAYNEAKHITASVHSVRETMQAIAAGRADLTWRLIVTDNNSTDGTEELARQAGADQVVFEPINQIARARNAGARAALAEVPGSPQHWMIFLDADSRICLGLAEEFMEHAQRGRVAAGGALLHFEPSNSVLWWAEPIFNTTLRIVSLTPGAFIFCRSDAYLAVGGFRQDVFAAEDGYLSWDIKRWGRSRGLGVIMLPKNRVVTSSRKMSLYRPTELATLFLRLIFSWKRLVKDKSKLGIFYDGRR
jgi:glycosyltransferase involved in cell wall biosynthesis